MNTNQIPALGPTFAENILAVSNHKFNGKKPNELVVAVVLTKRETGEKMFVGSADKKFVSAMFFYWWTSAIGPIISSRTRQLAIDFFAHIWCDPIGAHPAVDFIREGIIEVVPIEKCVEVLWEHQVPKKDLDDAMVELLHWVLDNLHAGKLRVAEKDAQHTVSPPPENMPNVVLGWVVDDWLKKAIILAYMTIVEVRQT